ncbi:hypothetical protein Tco_1108114 [Tanacetum coccineum]
MSLPTNVDYQADDLDAYAMNCDELNSAIDCSHGESSPGNGQIALTETETDITSNSNIIPYSQYLSETQQKTVSRILTLLSTRCPDIIYAVEQHRLESRTFEVKMNQVLSENERLLAQSIDHDIVKTVMNLSVNDGCETVNEFQSVLELKDMRFNKKAVDPNKVEAHPRNVKSSLNKRNGTVKVNGSASVQNSKKHDNSDYVCINDDDCMSSDNLCVSNSMNDVKFHAKPKKKKSKEEIWKPTGKVFTKMGYIWRPTGRTFTIVGNACPLTRITTTNEVPSRKPIVLESESPKPVVNLVYSRKPRKNKNTESVSKTEVVQIVLWYLDSGCSKHMTGDRSQLTNFISKFLGTVKFGNDQVAKIMGYGDYQIRNVTISRVYYVEGLGHNLFSVGQFCDSNLEVAFRQHTCFIRNLEGVDLLTGSRWG